MCSIEQINMKLKISIKFPVRQLQQILDGPGDSIFRLSSVWIDADGVDFFAEYCIAVDLREEGDGLNKSDLK